MYYYKQLENDRQNAGLSINKLSQMSGVGRDLIRSAENENAHRKEKLMKIINSLNSMEDRVKAYGLIDPQTALKQRAG